MAEHYLSGFLARSLPKGGTSVAEVIGVMMGMEREVSANVKEGGRVNMCTAFPRKDVTILYLPQYYLTIKLTYIRNGYSTDRGSFAQIN